MGRARPDTALSGWRAWLHDRAAGSGEQGALRGLAAVLADRVDGRGGADAPADLPDGFDEADVLAAARQWLLPAVRRRSGGAVYTPPRIAAGVVARAVHGWPGPTAPAVCDPACGGGAFLLAAARWLHGLGHDPDEVVDGLLWGADLDPVAVETAIAAVRLWARSVGSAGVAGPNLAVGDLLRSGADVWPDAPSFDLVVGNPPFQGQLGAATARSRVDARELAGRLGAAAGGYADTAALFLVVARRLAAPGGRVSLVLPESVLGARDAAGARAAALDGADLVGLWVATEPVFDAATKVCAPLLAVRPSSPPSPPSAPDAGAPEVQRAAGPAFSLLPPFAVPPTVADAWRRGGPWSRLALAAYGTPELELTDRAGVLGDLATATAGFRQQFYGLAPFVREAPEPLGAGLAPLVTAGLVDPARNGWGARPARFAGVRWNRPAVDLAALAVADPSLSRWVSARRVPKVLVATQTRVVEAWADPDGRTVPSVPVVSVEPRRAEDLALVAAVLLAPATSAWALAHAGGTALAVDTVKLAASQIAGIPLPVDRAAWRRGADLLGSGAPDWPRFGAAMVAAHGLPPDHPVLGWWLARLPGER